MSTTTSTAMRDTFKTKFEHEWHQKTDCLDHPDNKCSCLHDFVRTDALKEWMMRKEEGSCGKSNGERLVAEVTQGPDDCDPEDIITGNPPCIVVLSCLLSSNVRDLGLSSKVRDLGYLVYDFRTAGFDDKALLRPDINFDILRTDLGFLSTSDIETIIGDFDKRIWEFYPLHVHIVGKKLGGPLRFVPFCTRKNISVKGATATIFCVEIQEEFVSNEIKPHLGEPSYHQKFGNCYKFALKSVPDRDTYKNEFKAFGRLKGKPGILRSFGHFDSYQKAYCNGGTDQRIQGNILLELADMDLYESFSKYEPPQSSEEIIAYWARLIKVAAAIHTVHKDAGEDFDGWHGDVKPDNILLVKDEWRLADFGFSQVKKKGENPTAKLKRVGETYGAPETANLIPGESEFHQTIDTWSFGCVLSVTATWIVKGKFGIKQYATARRLGRGQRTNSDVSDAFHDGHDVLPEIKHWHNHLNEIRRHSDHVTPRILELIEKDMLLKESNRRDTCFNIHENLSRILKDAKQQFESKRKEMHPNILSALRSKNEAFGSQMSLDPPGLSTGSERTESQHSPPPSTPTEPSQPSIPQHSPPPSTPTEPSQPSIPQHSPPPSTPTELSRPSISHPSLTSVLTERRKVAEKRFWDCLKAKDPTAIDLFLELIYSYPDLARSSKHNRTPIMIAAQQYNIGMVLNLVHLSELSHQDNEGKTLLHHMILGLNLAGKTEDVGDFTKAIAEVIKVNAGVVTISDNGGRTPLYFCVQQNMLETAKILVPENTTLAIDLDLLVNAAKCGKLGTSQPREMLRYLLGRMNVKDGSILSKQDKWQRLHKSEQNEILRHLQNSGPGSASTRSRLNFFQHDRS